MPILFSSIIVFFILLFFWIGSSLALTRMIYGEGTGSYSAGGVFLLLGSVGLAAGLIFSDDI